MSWFENSLNHIETRLRAIIEGGSDVDGIPRKFHNQLFQALESSMQTSVTKANPNDQPKNNVSVAPDQYTLILPADQAKLLLTHPAALDHLSQKLAHLAVELKLSLMAPPMLRVVGSPTAENLMIHTAYSHSDMNDSYTAVLEDSPSVPNGQVTKGMPVAFLIVNGVKTFPLVEIVTNIGRSPDNHLVLDYPSVSRRHAQLRLINQRFTIFDLDSSRGTYVNGVPVVSQVLNPGDVILLAGIPLVYGHDTHAPIGFTQEMPFAD